jgi:diguanylate cyclase (GGDEF)-like protein
VQIEDGSSGLLVLGPRITEESYSSHDVALLRALADSSATALRNAGLLDRLRTQATIDPLTGCRNRRGFDELLATELARAKRHSRPLSLMIVDIDHFKRINDELGHDVGDQALKRIGNLLRSSFRVSDVACRYGGEEFAIVFPETTKSDALKLADRVRAAIEALEPNNEVPRTMTVSMGVSAFPEDGEDMAELFRSADQALYLAKSSGRNRVCAA